MRTLIFIIAVLMSNHVWAQDRPDPKEEKRFGVNLNLLGPTILLSVSIDYFVTPKTNVEIGTGIIGSFGGVKYHWSRDQNESVKSPYVGLNVIYIPEICINNCTPARVGLYIPVGVQFINKGGFTFAPEIAGLVLDNTKTPIWVALKLGYHF
jgi:hypothetical protein